MARVKPRPMPSPSMMLGSGGFLNAKDSARAKMMQLTTIREMKTPSVSYRSGTKACMTISTIVTKVAMMMINEGMRIFSGIRFRRSEMTRLEKTSTKVVARPMPMPLEA